jgi:2-keto-4-pentenoate hydratase/2-oxohepta-3-ene-1,7-dioic acid hydratase in catechol pathway
MKTINYNHKQIAPTKIVCIGRNYVEHIKELNNEMSNTMVIFNKPNSAITNELFYFNDDTRFEGEICFLIKDKQINAIGFGFDLTNATIQNKMKQKGLPWERAKSFDNSAIFGDFVEFNEDITKIKMKLFLNNNLIQIATYDLMIYKPNQILNEIQKFMSLEDGDIIMSGTPKGVGTYKKDDFFLAKIYCDNKIIVENSWIVK